MDGVFDGSLHQHLCKVIQRGEHNELEVLTSLWNYSEMCNSAGDSVKHRRSPLRLYPGGPQSPTNGHGVLEKSRSLVGLSGVSMAASIALTTTPVAPASLTRPLIAWGGARPGSADDKTNRQAPFIQSGVMTRDKQPGAPGLWRLVNGGLSSLSPPAPLTIIIIFVIIKGSGALRVPGQVGRDWEAAAQDMSLYVRWK